jgi:hypothetical protein
MNDQIPPMKAQDAIPPIQECVIRIGQVFQAMADHQARAEKLLDRLMIWYTTNHTPSREDELHEIIRQVGEFLYGSLHPERCAVCGEVYNPDNLFWIGYKPKDPQKEPIRFCGNDHYEQWIHAWEAKSD